MSTDLATPNHPHPLVVLAMTSLAGALMGLLATHLLRESVFGPLLFAGAPVPWWFYAGNAGIGIGIGFLVGILATAPRRDR